MKGVLVIRVASSTRWEAGSNPLAEAIPVSIHSDFGLCFFLQYFLLVVKGAPNNIVLGPPLFFQSAPGLAPDYMPKVMQGVSACEYLPNGGDTALVP